MKPLDEGQSTARSLRVPDKLWNQANEAAKLKGTTVAEHLRESLNELADAAPDNPSGILVRRAYALPRLKMNLRSALTQGLFGPDHILVRSETWDVDDIILRHAASQVRWLEVWRDYHPVHRDRVPHLVKDVEESGFTLSTLQFRELYTREEIIQRLEKN